MKKCSFTFVIAFLASASAFSLSEDEICLEHDENEYKALFEATSVTVSGGSPKGRTPPVYRAYECLMKSHRREEHLENLILNGSPAGQLYALGGLRAIGSSLFEVNMGRYEYSEETVTLSLGCSVGPEKVREIFRAIVEEKWPQ